MRIRGTRVFAAAALAGLGALAVGLIACSSDPEAKPKPRARVLVFSRTAEFRHDSIPAGVAAVTQLGRDNGVSVVATKRAKAFTARRLAGFAAVVFLNTTGDVLGPRQQRAIEGYIRRGGGWVGVHAAADTEYD